MKTSVSSIPRAFVIGLVCLLTSVICPLILAQPAPVLADPVTGALTRPTAALFKSGNGISTASGDVVGPASSTDNALSRFDLATGKLLQNSVLILDDLGNLKFPSVATSAVKMFATVDEVSVARWGTLTWSGGTFGLFTDFSGATDASTINLKVNGNNTSVATLGITRPSIGAGASFSFNVSQGAGLSTAKPTGHFLFYDSSQETQSSGYTEMVGIQSILTQTGTAAFYSLGLHRITTSAGSGAQGFLACYQASDTTLKVFSVDDAGRATAAGLNIGGTNGTMVDLLASATATLDFGSINAAASADLTITVTGATTGDVAVLGAPSSPTAGIVFNAFVSASNTVTVRAFNITGSPVDPASATYRAAIVSF